MFLTQHLGLQNNTHSHTTGHNLFYSIISSQSHETPGHSEHWPPGHPC